MIRTERLQEAQVSIIGMGLMGGSLAAALMEREACRRLVGVSRRTETAAKALALGIVHEAGNDIVHGVRGADIVILATPVRTIIQIIETIGQAFPAGCLLTDLGSTKQAIVEAMERLPAHVDPIGGHPMCGKETAGLAAASSLLYEGTTFVLTPLERTSRQAKSLARELVQAVGARPLLLDAARHDALTAAVSHVPHLISTALVLTAKSAGDSAVWEVAARAFQDMTRLSASDSTMLTDILVTNRSQVQRTLDRFFSHLSTLRQMLEDGNETSLRASISAAAHTRAMWHS